MILKMQYWVSHVVKDFESALAAYERVFGWKPAYHYALPPDAGVQGRHAADRSHAGRILHGRSWPDAHLADRAEPGAGLRAHLPPPRRGLRLHQLPLR